MKNDDDKADNSSSLVFEFLETFSKGDGGSLFARADLDVVEDTVGSLLWVVDLLDHFSGLVEASRESQEAHRVIFYIEDHG